MTLPATILDAAPPMGSVGIGLLLGGALFLVSIAIAIVLFKVLKRSLKLAFRIVIVVIVLVLAVLAATGVFIYSIVDGMNKPKPPATRRQR